MKRFWFLLGTVCVLFPAYAQMQTKAPAAKSGTSSNLWKCGAPSPAHAVPVADNPDHLYVVQQMKCTAARGEIAGVKEVEGTGTEFAEVKGDSATGHGIFVETLANGDKLHVSYDFKGTSKNKVFQSGTNKWTVVGGTGMLAGAKGGGTCTAKGNPDGSAEYECKGTYTLK
jgi:hypothetical protein